MELNTKKIIKERDRLGLTNYGLALKIGIKPYNLEYILKMKSTKLETIQKIADYFDVDAKDLLI
jgi:DNA-binding Xre family transcriptional regulator